MVTTNIVYKLNISQFLVYSVANWLLDDTNKIISNHNTTRRSCESGFTKDELYRLRNQLTTDI